MEGSSQLSVNMAMTLDGRVMRPDGRWHGLTSREDRRRMDEHRSHARALLLGKASLIADDPIVRPVGNLHHDRSSSVGVSHPRHNCVFLSVNLRRWFCNLEPG